MEHVKVTDELLYKYMPVVDAEIIRELERQIDTDYKFSCKFKRKMRHLIREEAYPWLGNVEKMVKKVAVFFVGVIGLVFIFTMSVEACREKFFETVKMFFEDSVLYSYFLSEEIGIFQNSEPSYIPEGYSEVNRIENDMGLIIIFENNGGEQIIWEQKLIGNGSNIVLDIEYDTQEIREINGSSAVVYLYSDGYAMAYYEHEGYVYLITADNLDSENLFKLIGSMND